MVLAFIMFTNLATKCLLLGYSTGGKFSQEAKGFFTPLDFSLKVISFDPSLKIKTLKNNENDTYLYRQERPSKKQNKRQSEITHAFAQKPSQAR